MNDALDTFVNSGFETTADVHAVSSHGVHHSYGALNLSATPPAAIVDEIVTDHSDEECNGAESDPTAVDGAQANATAADDQPHISDVSVQHSSNLVVVPVDMPAPDHTAV